MPNWKNSNIVNSVIMKPEAAMKERSAVIAIIQKL